MKFALKKNTTTYTHTYYTLKTDVIAYNNVEKNPISLSEKKKHGKKSIIPKTLSCLIISYFELVISHD